MQAPRFTPAATSRANRLACPTTREVADCVEFARDLYINLIVALGGGSSMDTAKGANFILTNGGKMSDYWGINKASNPMLPMIAIPTTAGTGSESQCYALIADEHTHQKMACGDDKAYPVIALLDPVLNSTCPRAVTANAGIDAISHAIESFVCTARAPVSQLFSREAWKLANGAFETVLREPWNLEARGQMLLASAYAGMAISQSMLGAAHSAANPLTAHFNIVHGRAVGIMLPHVIRFNSKDPAAAALYAELAHVRGAPKALTAVDSLIARINTLLNAAEMPASLAECGIKRDAIGKTSCGYSDAVAPGRVDAPRIRRTCCSTYRPTTSASRLTASPCFFSPSPVTASVWGIK